MGERMVNCPIQAVPKLHESLVEDMAWAVENEVRHSRSKNSLAERMQAVDDDRSAIHCRCTLYFMDGFCAGCGIRLRPGMGQRLYMLACRQRLLASQTHAW